MSERPTDPTKNTAARERIRELVRIALKEASPPAKPPSASPPSAVEHRPQHVVVNSLRERSERSWERDESAKSLLTELDLRGLDDGARVRVAQNAKFTPLAQDIIKERSLELIVKVDRGEPIKARSVAVGADHGGFSAKEQLKTWLETLGLAVIDLGTHSTEAVDYPDLAHAVASAVNDRRADVGIVIDGAGIGSAMAANKVPGVRAAACYNAALARNAREHNGANVLSLGSGQNTIDEMRSIVEAFLTTELTEERHRRRVEKIGSIQQRYSK